MAGYGFGAKVKLTVDRSRKAEFNKQISDMVGQIKVSNKFTVLQKDMDRVRREAQAMLNSNPLTLKVNKIDCSAPDNAQRSECIQWSEHHRAQRLHRN